MALGSFRHLTGRSSNNPSSEATNPQEARREVMGDLEVLKIGQVQHLTHRILIIPQLAGLVGHPAGLEVGHHRRMT